MVLCAETEAFYFQDFQLDECTYRIFNYRLASYTDFLRPGALECRGIMFVVHGDVAQRLASFPQSKFFNLNENPMTMNLDLSTIVSFEPKVDGSLISTYLHDGRLRLKSKGSINSDQAIAAMAFLDLPKNQQFKKALEECASSHYTVNCEWVGPNNRIVLGYDTDRLIVLNIRDNISGKTYYFSNNEDEMRDLLTIIDHTVTDFHHPTQVLGDPASFVAAIPSMNGIEGFVVRFASGMCVKVKTVWYLNLHHTKDSVTNPRRLFEAVVDECVDDLRSLFYEDTVAILMIDKMQQTVDGIYNHTIATVERFYNDNKDLSRKDFAIKGRAELPNLYFGLVMNLYLGKTNDYKSFLKAKYKEFGITDTQSQQSK